MKKIINHPLFAGSFIMIIGANAANFLNYLYHLMMVKLLTPPIYGELAALLSLIGLLGIVPASLSIVIIKFVSAAKNEDEIINIVSWFNSKVFIFSLTTFLLITISSPLISSFLKIDNNLVIILVAMSFIFSLAALLYKSVLQGILKFQQMVLTLFTETGLKLLLGVTLVYLGFSILGAVFGLVIASLVGFLLSRWFIRQYLKQSDKTPTVKPMLFYSIPVLIQSVAATSLYSSDIILVKHFFSAHDAGIYAIISTLGKIIFFGTGPIGAVMFPYVSQRQAMGESYKKVFLFSLILTLMISLSVLAIYLFVPQLVISLLNKDYLEAAPLLVWYGLFIALFSLSTLYVTLNLSTSRTNVVYLSLISAISQIILIWFFHQTLFAVILVSILVATLLLVGLFIYSSYEKNTSRDKSDISHSSSLQ